MTEDAGYQSLPLGLIKELEVHLTCDHDWQPGEEVFRWLQGQEYEHCTKCKYVRIDAKAFEEASDEDQDPVRDDPRLRGTDLPQRGQGRAEPEQA